MTPSCFTGTWMRESLTVDGQGPIEPGMVVWAQAGDHFSDIRRPRTESVLTGPGAFAGSTSFSSGRLIWNHVVDLPPAANHIDRGDDAGWIEWQDDLMLETGTVDLGDGEVTYVEKWRRLPGCEDGPSCRMSPESGLGVAVRTGQHVVALHLPHPTDPCRWAATYLRRSRIGWSPLIRIGHEETAIALERSLSDALDNGASDKASQQQKWTTHA